MKEFISIDNKVIRKDEIEYISMEEDKIKIYVHERDFHIDAIANSEQKEKLIDILVPDFLIIGDRDSTALINKEHIRYIRQRIDKTIDIDLPNSTVFLIYDTEEDVNINLRAITKILNSEEIC